ncbi:hypothetical protein L6258_03875 [Candidatus Parcubacteria bacterium]|nr:hypothetical protein [Candidatus Parcubacteria bacterium]
MAILYLDTSDRYKKLVKVGDHQVETEGDVLNAVKSLFEKMGIGWKDIEKVEINEGPGSFTGLRVGAAIANAANYALGGNKIPKIVVPKYGKAPNISKPKAI